MRKTLTLLLLISITLFSCKKEKLEKIDQTTNKSLSAKTDFIPKSELTGEELFKSIFFGVGVFAERIEYLDDVRLQVNALNQEQKDTLNGLLQNLTNSINLQHPSFFTEFKNSVVSNNQLEINNSLKIATKILSKNMHILIPKSNDLKIEVKNDMSQGEILYNNGEINPEKLANNTERYTMILQNDNLSISPGLPPCSWAVACVLYFAVAIHNTAAVVANVVAAVSVWSAVWIPDSWDGCPDCPIAPTNANGEETSLLIEMMVNSIAKAN